MRYRADGHPRASLTPRTSRRFARAPDVKYFRMWYLMTLAVLRLQGNYEAVRYRKGISVSGCITCHKRYTAQIAWRLLRSPAPPQWRNITLRARRCTNAKLAPSSKLTWVFREPIATLLLDHQNGRPSLRRSSRRRTWTAAQWSAKHPAMRPARRRAISRGSNWTW